MKNHKLMFCMLQLLILRIVGILLPIYAMVRAFTSIQRRRHYQVSDVVCISISFEQHFIYELLHFLMELMQNKVEVSCSK